MAKLTNRKTPHPEQTPLTNRNKKSDVNISFKYLYKCDVSCFNALHKANKNDPNLKAFDELQKFLYEADELNSIEEIIKNYTSRKGSKINGNHSSFVKKIIEKFKKEYPNERGLVSNNLIHIHTKRNGKGKFLIFGVNHGTTFYVLGFDPKHESL